LLKVPVHARILRMIIAMLVLLLIVVALYPMFWMLTTSFKTYEESLIWPPTVLPEQFIPDNYVQIFEMDNFHRYFSNTVIYSVVGTFLSVLLATMGGYAFAKLQFKGKRFLFFVVLSTLMIPNQVTLIPIFLICKSLGWVDTYLGLIIPGVVSAFGIFLIRQFALGVPNELFDAARIDGANEGRIFAWIFLPVVIPPVTTLVVLEFMGRWNDMFWPLIIVNSSELRPLTLALTVLYRTEWAGVVRWPQMCAAMTIAAVPVLILYAAFQKYFTSGLVISSGIKG